MIYNRPRAKKKVSLTWYFNHVIEWDESDNFNATVHTRSGRSTFDSISIYIGTTYKELDYRIRKSSQWRSTKVWDSDNGWEDSGYRTVTFDEEPTGGLLAFLQANATPQ